VPDRIYSSEGSVRQPSLTPLFADSITYTVWPYELDAEDSAADLYDGYNLVNGTAGGNVYAIRSCLLDRHGRRPSSAAPRNYFYFRGSPLPGGVNVAFFDGHVEFEKWLNQLWTLQWHRGWVTPDPLP